MPTILTEIVENASIELLAQRFAEIMAKPQKPLPEFKVGEFFISFIAPDKVKRVTKKYLVGVSDRYPFRLYLRATEITETDARFLVANWNAYRIWLLYGVKGMLKAQAAYFDTRAYLLSFSGEGIE